MASGETWQDSITTVLDNHKVRETVVDTLLWEEPIRTGLLFSAGVALFVVTEVFNLGIMMVIGIIAIAQLLLFRAAKYAQDHNLLFTKVDLKKEFVLTPSPETVSTTIEIIGESFRLIEETVKELALSNDYLKLAQGFMVLIFFSAIGRILSLSALMLLTWVMSFSLLPLYRRNQKFFDDALLNGENTFNRISGKAKEE